MGYFLINFTNCVILMSYYLVVTSRQFIEQIKGTAIFILFWKFILFSFTFIFHKSIVSSSALFTSFVENVIKLRYNALNFMVTLMVFFFFF